MQRPGGIGKKKKATLGDAMQKKRKVEVPATSSKPSSSKFDRQQYSRLLAAQINDEGNPLRAAFFEAGDVQQELEDMNAKCDAEIMKVQAKWNVERAPMVEKRHAAMEKLKGVWGVVMSRHPLLCDMITDEDFSALLHLYRLEVVENEDIQSGYTISMYFDDECPYFKEKKLVRTYKFDDDGVMSTSNTPITWEVENNPVGSTDRYIFLQWFSGTISFDEEEDEELGDALKEQVFPNPLEAFLQISQEDNVDDEMAKAQREKQQ